MSLPTSGTALNASGGHALSHAAVADVKAHFGAVGDGVTDDTAAIQAAIDAAVGGTMSGTVPTPQRTGSSGTGSVYLPAGVYKITSPLVIRAIQGLRFWGAGSRATFIRVSGTITQAIQMLGASLIDMRGFTVDGVGGFAGTGHVTYGLTWDWDPALTVNSSYRSTFHDIWVVDLDFKYGWDVGSSSSTYDVSNGYWSHCQVGGDFTPGDGTTTQWQAGWHIGSGTTANILNHYFTDCHQTFLKHSYYVNSVLTVGMDHNSTSDVENFVYKVGPGVVTVKDTRIEDSWRIADSVGGAGYTAHLLCDGVTFENALHAEASGRFIKWNYPGTVELKNCYIPFDGYAANPRKIYCDVHPANGWVSISLRNTAIHEASPTGPAQHIEANSTTEVRLFAEGLTALDNSQGWRATYATTAIGFNLAGEIAVGSGETTGTSGTDQVGLLRLQHPADGSTGAATLSYNDGSTDIWWLYKLASANTLFLRDMVNARMHATYTAGSAVTSSTTDFNGKLTADSIKTASAAHGSLPAASNYAAGAQYYCTTDKKPVWSDGSAHWVDAAGANHT